MERKRDQETIARLKQLAQNLFSEDITNARLAAHNLAWMQEDGLAILKVALMGDYSRTTKKAAAYGLRRMNGRMKQQAMQTLEQGLHHRNRTTKAACLKSLELIATSN